MLKKITFITLATIMVMGTFFIHDNGYAQSADDLKNIQEKREHMKDELSEAEDKKENLISEIKQLNKEMEQGNAMLEEKQVLIEETERDIADTIKAIHSLQAEVKELESSMDKRYNLLKERLASYQKSGGMAGYLDVIFGADNFSDLVSRVSMVTKITDSDTALMEQYEQESEHVTEKETLALGKLDELNGMKVKQEDAFTAINEEQQENEVRIKALGEKQQELAESADQLQVEDSELASLEKETKQSIAAAAKAKEDAKLEAELKAKAQAKQEAESKAKAQAKQKAQLKAKTEEKQSEHTNQDGETENAETEKNDETTIEQDADTNGKTYTMTATAYTVKSSGGHGVTATGIDLIENPDRKVIAVDPKVIPLGSIVFVEGYGYAIAGDTGGLIKGNKIDVFVATEQAAAKWGVRTVQVTIQ